MKNFRFIFACTAALLVIGFFGGSILTEIIKRSYEITFIGFEPLESLTPQISFGLLLAFCSVSAWAISWAYAHARNHDFSKGVYLAALAGSISIAGATMLMRLLWFGVFIRSDTDLPEIPNIVYRYINFFQWGAWPVFLLFGPASILLLWIARQRKQRALAETF